MSSTFDIFKKLRDGKFTAEKTRANPGDSWRWHDRFRANRK
jgi:hypothetical protein